MENEDIFNMLDAPAPKEEKPAYTKQPYRGGNNKGGNRDSNPNWGRKDFQPVELKRENMTVDKKSVTLFLSSKAELLPEEAREKILKTMRFIASKDFKLRIAYGSNDAFLAEVASLFNDVEVYLPWRGYNKEVKNPYSIQPSELAYRASLQFHGKFADMPDAVRTIIANEVNMVLGKNCDNLVGHIFAWSPCGSESLTRETDYKTLGNTSIAIKMARAFTIPYSNINRADFNSDKLSKILGV